MREVWAIQVHFYESSIVYSDKFKYILRTVQYSVFIEHPRFLFKLDLVLPLRVVQVHFCGSSRACYKKFKCISRAVQYSVSCGVEIHCTNLNVSSFDHLNQ
jgi:hypothetical protein